MRDTYQRVLVQACVIAGDESALAEKLGIPVKTVVGWLLGHRLCPDDAFLRAVDLVLSSTKERSRETRAMLDEIKKRHRYPA